MHVSSKSSVSIFIAWEVSLLLRTGQIEIKEKDKMSRDSTCILQMTKCAAHFTTRVISRDKVSVT